jgi:hypothetical protein
MSSLKAITADLLSVTTGAYDQTKTTLLGSMALQTFSGIPAVSPPANQWLDVFTDSGETPLSMEYTVNGRLFVITAITAGLARVIAYSLNATTGVHTYLGKIQLTFPNLAATTHTIRGFKIDDTNTSNICSHNRKRPDQRRHVFILGYCPHGFHTCSFGNPCASIWFWAKGGLLFSGPRKH